MKPRDIFKIIVATVGLLIVCIGVVGVVTAAISALSAPSPYDRNFQLLASIAVAEIVFGFLIMKGYPPFVDIAFPPASSPSPEPSPTVVAETGPECVACRKRMPEGSKLCPACGWTQPG